MKLICYLTECSLVTAIVVIPWNILEICRFHCASLSSREAYRDWQLTTNFELWVEIFCVPTCSHIRIPKECLPVCIPRNEITIASSISVYISYWCIHGKVFTSTTTWKPKNLIFFFKKSSKLNFDFCWRAGIYIQVGLNMHLCDNIGDASSTLRGLISSWMSIPGWTFWLQYCNSSMLYKKMIENNSKKA